MRERVAVAMSGGVDSSVTAALLQQDGYEVVGVSMQLWEPEKAQSKGKTCCSLTDVLDAGRVAAKLGIEFHVLDMREEFGSTVVRQFMDAYRHGETPNPCVVCNDLIKFGLLLERVAQLGAKRLATGHYARIAHDPSGTPQLLSARCLAKDQSYFLYRLSREQLSRILFPLGDLASKDETRRIAASLGLPVAAKRESQEICFIPDNDYASFLEGRDPALSRSGDIVHLDGRVLGYHTGIHRYTVGQRKGLGIAWPVPLHVIYLDPERNRVIVGERRHLSTCDLRAGELSWVTPPHVERFRASCSIRYRQMPVPCHVLLADATAAAVTFDAPLSGVTPGQSVVFYDGDRVLGGGVILR